MDLFLLGMCSLYFMVFLAISSMLLKIPKVKKVVEKLLKI